MVPMNNFHSILSCKAAELIAIYFTSQNVFYFPVDNSQVGNIHKQYKRTF